MSKLILDNKIFWLSDPERRDAKTLLRVKYTRDHSALLHLRSLFSYLTFN